MRQRPANRAIVPWLFKSIFSAKLSSLNYNISLPDSSALPDQCKDLPVIQAIKGGHKKTPPRKEGVLIHHPYSQLVDRSTGLIIDKYFAFIYTT